MINVNIHISFSISVSVIINITDSEIKMCKQRSDSEYIIHKNKTMCGCVFFSFCDDMVFR